MRSTLVPILGLLFPLAASATTLPTTGTPLGTITPVSAGDYGGGTLASTGNITLTAPTFTGSYSEIVTADGSNMFCPYCLDFVYRVDDLSSSTASPTQIIERLTTSSFDGFMVDASFYGGGVQPYSATRSSTGGVISFNFLLTPSMTTTMLSDNSYTAYMILQTNATAYQLGDISLQDGTAATGPLAYVPATATAVGPEPGSLALFGTGLLGAIGVMRRRLKTGIA